MKLCDVLALGGAWCEGCKDELEDDGYHSAALCSCLCHRVQDWPILRKFKISGTAPSDDVDPPESGDLDRYRAEGVLHGLSLGRKEAEPVVKATYAALGLLEMYRNGGKPTDAEVGAIRKELNAYQEFKERQNG